MRAELKRLHSPDADLRSYKPSPEQAFSILVQAMVGHEGGAAEESFNFVVCSPEWLHQRYLETGAPIFGASHIVVDDFDYMEIEAAIKKLCRSIEGRDWSEIASKLGRYGSWEFADYRVQA